ncbi:MAG: hypothetical protein WBA74_16880 [Cyclobacteriaceae bacterium]
MKLKEILAVIAFIPFVMSIRLAILVPGTLTQTSLDFIASSSYRIQTNECLLSKTENLGEIQVCETDLISEN